VADALTSVGAILALLAGKYFGWHQLDPLIGLVGVVVIVKWALGLIKATGWELLDGHALSVDFGKLKARIEGTGSKIVDLHIWNVAPKVIACELVVSAPSPRGIDHYRHILHQEFGVHHSVIEERLGTK
jgi:Co/Zn/Cd efflux system component